MKYLRSKLAQFDEWILSIVSDNIDDITRARIDYMKNIKQTKQQIKNDLRRYEDIANSAKELGNKVNHKH